MAKCANCACEPVCTESIYCPDECEHFSPKIVPCKDCKHFNGALGRCDNVRGLCISNPNEFCSNGERREGE